MYYISALHFQIAKRTANDDIDNINGDDDDDGEPWWTIRIIEQKNSEWNDECNIDKMRASCNVKMQQQPAACMR